MGVPTHSFNYKFDSYLKCQAAGQKAKTHVEKGAIKVKYFCKPDWRKK